MRRQIEMTVRKYIGIKKNGRIVNIPNGLTAIKIMSAMHRMLITMNDIISLVSSSF